MTDQRPILSICIPTYNRAEVLNETLLSIVNNKSFSEEVEVIISDNASSDDTAIVCKKYSDKFPNVRYYRNDVNIKDANFLQVLSLATGEYLKLNNDWATLEEEALQYMLDAIKANIREKINIYFTDNRLYTSYKKNKGPIESNDLNDFISIVSTFTTAIFIFGIWGDKLNQIKDPLKYSSYLLNQVDWFFQLQKNSKAIIYNKRIYDFNSKMTQEKRSGYNWFQVHVDNYYKIMKPYYEEGFVSKKTLVKDKKNLLYHFQAQIAYSIFGKPEKWAFETDNWFTILNNNCKGIPQLWFYIIKSPYNYLKLKMINKTKKRLKQLLLLTNMMPIYHRMKYMYRSK